MTEARAFIENVSVVNFKSIGNIDVALRPLTVLVGRNGSGKSNFLDSLHFVADALVTTLQQAISKRGGAKAITHRQSGSDLRITITFRLSEGRRATYSLELEEGRVKLENLDIADSEGESRAGFKRVLQSIGGYATSGWFPRELTVSPDRLALVAFSGFGDFREAFDALASMRFYRLDPDAMRELQDPDEGTVLREDGANITSVLRRLQIVYPKGLERQIQFLNVIVPEMKDLQPVQLGPKETLSYSAGNGKSAVLLYAANMSDGTLRALGSLIAARHDTVGRPPSLICIEEPETSLHPGAVAVLMDAFREASAQTQIILTSHSPDLLDHVDVETDALLLTDLRDGATTIAAVDGASLDAIRRDLYTPGELLRMDQLHPVAAR